MSEPTSLELLWDTVDAMHDRDDKLQAAFIHGASEALYSPDERDAGSYEEPALEAAYRAGYAAALPFTVAP